MTVPGRLTVGAGGKLTGPAQIEYNSPFPTRNGTPGGSGSMRGLIFHTMVGDLPGTIEVFNREGFGASAFFGIDQAGKIWQFGPVGFNWMAWAQMAGNEAWYSCEMADHGSTQNPYTAEQITAGAQVAECLSAFAGFPLQITDSVDGYGLGTHVMGGAAWGGHSCPGPGPRAGQRTAIVALAKEIRAGNPPPSGPYRHIAAAGQTLGQIAAARSTTAGHLLQVSAEAYTADDEAALAALKLPAGTPFYTSNPG
jgi:hypothetical protein